MKTIDLLSLTLEDFRSVVEPLRLEFPHRGLYAIRGKNLDTGGSSRVGKSTINLGISEALGYCPFPGTELKCWFSDEPRKVKLAVQTPEHRLDIDRGARFHLDVDNVTVGGGAKAAEAKLRELLGLSPEMLAALTYRKQRSNGTFLSKTNVEIQEFLTAVLGLDTYEAVAGDADTRAKTAEKHCTELAGALEYLRADHKAKNDAFVASDFSLRDLKALRETLDKAEALVVKWEANVQLVGVKRKDQEAKRQAAKDQRAHDTTLVAREHDAQGAKTRAEAAALDGELRALRAQAKTLSEEAQATERLLGAGQRAIVCPGPPTLEKLKELLTQLDLQLGEQRAALTTAEAVLMSATRDVKTKTTTISTARGSTSCSECGRPFDNAADIAAHVQTMEVELHGLQAAEAEARKDVATEQLRVTQVAAMAGNMRLEVALATAEAKLATVTAEGQAKAAKHKDLLAKADADKRISDDLWSRVRDIGANVDAEFARNFTALDAAGVAAETELRLARPAAEHTREALRCDENHNARVTEDKVRAEADLQGATARLQRAQDELAAAQATQSQERDFSALVGRDGFLGAIFDEVLAEVAEETNGILAKVPNVSDVTLAFRSESVTAKGTTRRAITPVVTVGGHEAPFESGCSGGMQGALYLAADLAVIDVVSRRLGVSPGWLVLDEALTGLGPVEKEGCLDVLEVYAQRKLVLVVDHDSEVKEAIPGINLEYRNGRTTIATKP